MRFFICFFFLLNFANSLCAQVNYPVPPRTDKTLFYLQRTHNCNTIVYESNVLNNGLLNTDEPVSIYWIRYEEGGNRAELSFLQRRAFGLSYKCIDSNEGKYLLKFNNLQGRDVYMLKNASIYRAYTLINNEFAELLSVFIKSPTNSLGIPLSVEYVELQGIAVKSKKTITERFKP